MAEAQVSARVLIVEDTPPLAEMYRQFVLADGHLPDVATDGAEASAMAAANAYDVVLLDLQLPDMNGLDILSEIKATAAHPAVIVATAHGTIGKAVEAMRAGADDFLVKPFNGDRLIVTLRNVIQKRRLSGIVATIGPERTASGYEGILGESLAMQAIYRIIESAAPSKASVFVTGESGAGKELCAAAIHKRSPRADRPFIAINCGAIPHDLMESEIFGHVKGAFTGATADRVGAAARADGGTLFLDELGEMPLELQVKLLRFVQTSGFTKVGGAKLEAVDVRFVAATNRDPLAEVKAGRFREDLYYRLHVIPIHMPALRDRGEDVMLLARAFLRDMSAEEGRRFGGFTAEAERMLLDYPWPGNVRELQNVIRNLVVLNDADVVDAAILRAALPALTGGFADRDAFGGAARESRQDRRASGSGYGGGGSNAPMRPPDLDDFPLMPLAEMERRLIDRALRQTGQNVPRAAALLEVSPSTVYRKLQRWGIDVGVA